MIRILPRSAAAVTLGVLGLAGAACTTAPPPSPLINVFANAPTPLTPDSVPPQPTATPTPTAPPAATATPTVSGSVVLVSGTVSAAPSSANPPATLVTSFAPPVAGRQVTVYLTAQLPSSRLAVQLVQVGTTTVLASNLAPASNTTTVGYVPATTGGVLVNVSDLVNPNVTQTITVLITQQQ